MSNGQVGHERGRVAVVIVNWNGGSLLVRCLESLETCGVEPLEVIVVDNGSEDGSADVMEGRSRGRLIRNADNLGFAAACNQGMEMALEGEADFVFLLNNDAILEPDALAILLDAAARRPSAGLFAGKILLGDRRRIWCAGVDIGFYPNLQRLRGFMKVDTGQFDAEGEVPALTGCGLLIRRPVLETVGLFDTDFFVYVEDVDLAARAAKAGFGSLYVPEAVMIHDAGSSTGGGYGAWRKYMVAYNVVLYLKKHGTAALWATFVLLEVLAWPVLFLTAIPRGRAGAALSKIRGTTAALMGRPVIRPGAATTS